MRPKIILVFGPSVFKFCGQREYFHGQGYLSFMAKVNFRDLWPKGILVLWPRVTIEVYGQGEYKFSWPNVISSVVWPEIMFMWPNI